MGASYITRSPAAAAAVLAAAAITVGGVGLAAPANAADSYIALSYSLQSQKSGMAIADTENAAVAAAIQDCRANGGGNECLPYITVKNACAAIAVSGAPFTPQEVSTGTGSAVALAQKQAVNKNPGGRLAVSGCAASLQIPQPDQSSPPPPPPPPPPVEDDYDRDGLSKHDELFKYHTNPFVADTDLDDINDGDEVRNGTNPLNHFDP